MPARLDRLAQGQHFVPGGGIRPAFILEQGLRVPDPADGVGDVERDLLAVHHAGILRAGEERFGDGLAGGVQRRRPSERGQVEQLAFGHQGAHIQRAGTAVIDTVGGIASHKAWAQFLTHALDAFHADIVLPGWTLAKRSAAYWM